jgi:hypothetical protein
MKNILLGGFNLSHAARAGILPCRRANAFETTFKPGEKAGPHPLFQSPFAASPQMLKQNFIIVPLV